MLPIPHLDHPLFRLERRRVRWGASSTQLRTFTLIASGLVVVLTLVAWLLSVGYTWDGYGPQTWIGYSLEFLAVAGFAGIAADVILDLASLAFTLNSIDVPDNPKWWDLLRLAVDRPESVIIAKHTVAQVRAWRVMVIVLSLRACLALVGVIHLFGTTSGFDGYLPPSQYLLIPTLVVFGATYVIEPFWRMGAMTALGLRISARVKNTAMAALVGFGAVVAVWIVQAVIMGVILYGTLVAVNNLAYNSEDVAMCGVFFACCATSWIIYAFYRSLRAQSLAIALRYAFAD